MGTTYRKIELYQHPISSWVSISPRIAKNVNIAIKITKGEME